MLHLFTPHFKVQDIRNKEGISGIMIAAEHGHFNLLCFLLTLIPHSHRSTEAEEALTYAVRANNNLEILKKVSHSLSRYPSSLTLITTKPTNPEEQ